MLGGETLPLRDRYPKVSFWTVILHEEPGRFLSSALFIFKVEPDRNPVSTGLPISGHGLFQKFGRLALL
jgi:hypothetical protein